MYMMIKHKVEDYAKWKSAFDAHAPAREKAEMYAQHIFREVNDPNNVFVLCEIKSIDKANALSASPETKEIVKKAGVIGQPEVYFLKE
jgi:hypothetical protein